MACSLSGACVSPAALRGGRHQDEQESAHTVSTQRAGGPQTGDQPEEERWQYESHSFTLTIFNGFDLSGYKNTLIMRYWKVRVWNLILLALYDYLAHHTSRFTTDHFLDVTPSNNNKKLEKLQRSSFVDYVSEVIPRPSHASTLGSSNSTLTSSHRELSVKSQPRPSTGGSKYKYSGECQTRGNVEPHITNCEKDFTWQFISRRDKKWREHCY